MIPEEAVAFESWHHPATLPPYNCSQGLAMDFCIRDSTTLFCSPPTLEIERGFVRTWVWTPLSFCEMYLISYSPSVCGYVHVRMCALLGQRYQMPLDWSWTHNRF